MLHLGTIATGNDIQTQCVVESGLSVHAIQILMHNHTSQLRKECCWAISNIAAEQCKFKSFSTIIFQMHCRTYEDGEIWAREALDLTNMLAGGTPAQSHSLCLPMPWMH